LRRIASEEANAEQAAAPAPDDTDIKRQLAGFHSETFQRTPKQEIQADAGLRPCASRPRVWRIAIGKTFGFCELIAERALQADESRHLIARLHNIDVRQSVMLDTWPKMMRLAFPDVRYTINKSDQFATFTDTARRCGSAGSTTRSGSIRSSARNSRRSTSTRAARSSSTPS
jgi:hypothetical protein